jgi:hypothetical protein
MRYYWLSSKAMTVEVEVRPGRFEDAVVTKTPPIVRKFDGRPFSLLIRWMTSQGGFRMEALDSEGKE